MPPTDTEQRRPRRHLLVSGLGVVIAGAMKVVRIASLVALVFAAAGPAEVATGLGLALVGTTVATVWIALRTSMSGAQAAAQSIIAAFVAVAVTDAVAVAAPGTEGATALVVVVVSGLLSGAVALGMGLAGAARLVRYLPHPVVAGVLAATGWLLVTSAVSMMAAPVEGGLMDAAAIGHWAPGFAIGLAMFFAAQLIRHPLVVPASLTIATGGFFAVAAIRGAGVDRLGQEGWLFGPFPDGSLWRLPPADALWIADWSAVLAQAPTLATAAFATALLAVLYTNAMELDHGVDMLPSRELRETGIASLLGAVFAGMPTSLTPSGTRLAQAMLVRRRTDAVLAPLFALAVLAFGAGILEAFPRPVLGAVLIYLGLDYLNSYLFAGLRRYGRLDLLAVSVIVVTVAVFGLLPGIGVGMAVTVLMFVVASAGEDVVGAWRTGKTLRSRVTRGIAARNALFEHGDRTVVYHLEGTVFFGTADRLTATVRSRLAEEPAPRAVVLDVGGAGTFDATGGMAVLRIARAAERVGTEVLVVGAGPNVQAAVDRSGASVRYEDDLDAALEHCEERLLEDLGLADARPTFEDALDRLSGGGETWSELRGWFDEVEAVPGDTLIEQGDEANDFWILADGRVSAVLVRSDFTTLRLESLVPGQVIGELGFVTHAPRSARIVADEASRLFRMDRDAWQRLSDERPDLALALRDLMLRLAAERVQHLSAALGAARS